MKTFLKIFLGKKNYLIPGLLMCIGFCLLYGCAASRTIVKSAQYIFNYEGADYRIQCIISETKDECMNRLMGKDLLAVDHNMDQTIDEIVTGKIEFEDAQKIYAYGLESALKDNKLKIRVPENGSYSYEDEKYTYKIESYQSGFNQRFNELKVLDKNKQINQEVSIFLDQNADGTLNKVLKGSLSIEEVQTVYSNMVENGLANGAMEKIDSFIIVKEK